MTQHRPIAFFDLDHTLLPLDSDQSWGSFTVALGWVISDEFEARNQAFYQDYVAGSLDIGAYIRFATEAICRMGKVKSLEARAQYMKKIIEPAIHASALRLIDAHRQQGHRLVMVSATNEFITEPIAERLGLETLICTELQRGPDGWFTGELKGVPALREGKVVRVLEWLSNQDLRLSDVETTFYSDSLNDLPLLEQVDHPVATNPDPRLNAIALKRQWPILHLFESA